MKHIILIITICLFPLLANAQASGGQVKRKQTNIPKRSNTQNRHSKRKVYSPIEMDKNTYYMCINETWVIKKGQELCREMEAKGYNAELIIDPDPRMGYHVSIYKTTDKKSAISFYENFKDARWSIAYPFYNKEYLPNFIAAVSESYVEIPITQSWIEGHDASGYAVSGKMTISLYILDKILYMSMSHQKDDIYMCGPLSVINTKEEKETQSSFGSILMNCIWQNTKNNYKVNIQIINKGKCQDYIINVTDTNQEFRGTVCDYR